MGPLFGFSMSTQDQFATFIQQCGFGFAERVQRANSTLLIGSAMGCFGSMDRINQTTLGRSKVLHEFERETTARGHRLSLLLLERDLQLEPFETLKAHEEGGTALPFCNVTADTPLVLDKSMQASPRFAFLTARVGCLTNLSRSRARVLAYFLMFPFIALIEMVGEAGRHSQSMAIDLKKLLAAKV